jgi:hypothetical protein
MTGSDSEFRESYFCLPAPELGHLISDIQRLFFVKDHSQRDYLPLRSIKKPSDGADVSDRGFEGNEMKALAYRAIYTDSASVETDQSLTGDGTDDTPLSVESAPRVENGVYQIMFSKGVMTIQGVKPSDDVEEEYWDHVVYQHDFCSDPFARPSDLVEVYHDASLLCKGTSMIPLSLKPQTDGSIAGHETITEPLS